MTNVKFRPYQEECIHRIIENHSKGIHRQICSLPTASGKTLNFGHLIKALNLRAFTLAHSTELLEQSKIHEKSLKKYMKRLNEYDMNESMKLEAVPMMKQQPPEYKKIQEQKRPQACLPTSFSHKRNTIQDIRL